MNHWLLDRLSRGDAVLVPAIIYYELRRELLRAQKASGLARLDAFVRIDLNRYLELTDEALRFAAELWAKSRQQGRPTSSTLDLDIDVILAAQALTLADEAHDCRYHQRPPSTPVCGRSPLDGSR